MQHVTVLRSIEVFVFSVKRAITGIVFNDMLLNLVKRDAAISENFVMEVGVVHCIDEQKESTVISVEPH